jgi:acyl-coenzyme A thioesterase 13
MSEDCDIAHISGNASEEVKRLLANPGAFFTNLPLDLKGPIFGQSITERLVVTEISVDKKADEPKKLEGRVVCEITVEEGILLSYSWVLFSFRAMSDMVNGGGSIHGGCSAFLIDV